MAKGRGGGAALAVLAACAPALCGCAVFDVAGSAASATADAAATTVDITTDAAGAASDAAFGDDAEAAEESSGE